MAENQWKLLFRMGVMGLNLNLKRSTTVLTAADCFCNMFTENVI